MTLISPWAAILAVTALAAPVAATAATETVLWNFRQPQDGYPSGRLTLVNGLLFGTAGGKSKACCGQVFKLIDSGGTWTEKAVAIFKQGGAPGEKPRAGLLLAGDVLYGTNEFGGDGGGGTVFALYRRKDGAWVPKSLYSFNLLVGSASPECDLIMDGQGSLYGTTPYGGTWGEGTVFQLTQSNNGWSEAAIYNFGFTITDGGVPHAGLMSDSAGNLYGTTEGGGTYDNGTVFELTPNFGQPWNESILYSFGNGNDGQLPYGVLIADPNGSLYGTTFYGGASGKGTVFELYQSGGAWKEKVLYQFTGGSDGGAPNAGLTWNGNGTALYGTASGGGTGDGVVFELTQSGGDWSETVLHSFSGKDGAHPLGAVILDQNGVLYGTTFNGGTYGNGTVWQITP